MNTEQREYGGGWIRCAACGVFDAIARKTYDKTSRAWQCTDVAQCRTWRAELTAKGLTAGVDAPRREHRNELKYNRRNGKP